MSEKTLLITGFDPFGGEKINPSYEAVKLLPNKIGNINIIKLELPTAFSASVKKLRREIERISPDIVILTGQAGGRNAITPERVAVNFCDASVPDNDGYEPHDEKIYDSAPAAYFSTLPIRKMTNAILKEGIPASISNTAGTYVCNRVMYEALHISEMRRTNGEKTFDAGFIHVPYITSQTEDKNGVFGMELEDIARGLYATISVMAE